MITVTINVESMKQADALHEYFRSVFVQPKPDLAAARQAISAIAKEHPEMIRQPVPAPTPTPLEVAIAKLDETPTAEELGNPTEKLADPFAQLQASYDEVAAVLTAAEGPKAEKKPRKSAKKEAAPEPEKSVEKPLDLDGIKKASMIALELIGAPAIQEALAKFGATDEKNVLRMSALRTQDYALYVEYLKKKVNDAAKEWPADEAAFLAESEARRNAG